MKKVLAAYGSWHQQWVWKLRIDWPILSLNYEMLRHPDTGHRAAFKPFEVNARKDKFSWYRNRTTAWTLTMSSSTRRCASFPGKIALTPMLLRSRKTTELGHFPLLCRRAVPPNSVNSTHIKQRGYFVRAEMLERDLPWQYFGWCIMRCQLLRQFESLQWHGAPMCGSSSSSSRDICIVLGNTFYSHASHGACPTLGG